MGISLLGRMATMSTRPSPPPNNPSYQFRPQNSDAMMKRMEEVLEQIRSEREKRASDALQDIPRDLPAFPLELPEVNIVPLETVPDGDAIDTTTEEAGG
jgi:hypothetical protein